MGKELLQKVQVVQANQTALPHCCIVCTNFKGSFIDIGLDVEFYGVVYLCPSCFKAVSLLAGFVPAENLETAKKELEHKNLVIEELEQRVETYESVLDGINSLRGRSSFDDLSESTSMASVHENSKGTSKLPKGIIGQGTIEVSGSSESTDESGHRSVRDDDSIASLIDGI